MRSFKGEGLLLLMMEKVGGFCGMDGWLTGWLLQLLFLARRGWIFYNKWRLIMNGGYTRHDELATRSSLCIIPSTANRERIDRKELYISRNIIIERDRGK